MIFESVTCRSYRPVAGAAEWRPSWRRVVARRVLKGYRPHAGYFPREFIPYKKEAAWEKMQPKFDANPDLAKSASGWKDYFDQRGR